VEFRKQIITAQAGKYFGIYFCCLPVRSTGKQQNKHQNLKVIEKKD